jgi:hypothetical protein
MSALTLFLALSGCAAQPTVQLPVEVTRVVMQEVEVTREIVRVETQVVVVTATQEPAPPSVVPTIEPTATAAPTAIPEPTPVPEPTIAQPLADGEWVDGEIIRTVRIYDIPNEFEGKEVATAEPGIPVRVLYRGGQWYYVESARTSDAEPGWVYKDWLKIAPEDEARIQPFPRPLPVLVTRLTQTYRDGKDVWTGTVMNVGSQTAYDVQMEITLSGSVGTTETLNERRASFVDSRNLEPGQSSNFVVVTDWLGQSVYYSYKVLWTER